MKFPVPMYESIRVFASGWHWGSLAVLSYMNGPVILSSHGSSIGRVSKRRDTQPSHCVRLSVYVVVATFVFLCFWTINLLVSGIILVADLVKSSLFTSWLYRPIDILAISLIVHRYTRSSLRTYLTRYLVPFISRFLTQHPIRWPWSIWFWTKLKSLTRPSCRLILARVSRWNCAKHSDLVFNLKGLAFEAACFFFGVECR